MRSVVEPRSLPGKRRLTSTFSGAHRRDSTFMEAPTAVGMIMTLLPGMMPSSFSISRSAAIRRAQT